jgi:hypothetical protein
LLEVLGATGISTIFWTVNSQIFKLSSARTLNHGHQYAEEQSSERTSSLHRLQTLKPILRRLLALRWESYLENPALVMALPNSSTSSTAFTNQKIDM